MMAPTVASRVGDHKAIKSDCDTQRQIKGDPTSFVRDAIRRSMAFLRAADADTAIDALEKSLKALPNDPELLTMLGRCQVERGSATSAAEAEDALRRAYENGGRRPEVFDYWMRAKEVREDWKGVIEVSDLANSAQALGPLALRRAEAFIKRGDILAQGNSHEDAEKVYFEGAEDLKAILRGSLPYYLHRDVRVAQNRLITRWLGAVQLVCDHPSKMRRLFGASTLSLFGFGMCDLDKLRTGVTALDRWLGWIEQRGQIAPSNVEKVRIEWDRIKRLQEMLHDRGVPPDFLLFVDNFVATFRARANKLNVLLQHSGE